MYRRPAGKRIPACTHPNPQSLSMATTAASPLHQDHKLHVYPDTALSTSRSPTSSSPSTPCSHPHRWRQPLPAQAPHAGRGRTAPAPPGQARQRNRRHWPKQNVNGYGRGSHLHVTTAMRPMLTSALLPLLSSVPTTTTPVPGWKAALRAALVLKPCESAVLAPAPPPVR